MATWIFRHQRGYRHRADVVEFTGRQTKFSKIAESLSSRKRPTEFERSIKDFSYLIMKNNMILVIFIFLVNAVLKAAVIFAVVFVCPALAVGLTPELLPMIINPKLSKGSLAMSKHGDCKKLSSIQILVPWTCYAV